MLSVTAIHRLRKVRSSSIPVITPDLAELILTQEFSKRSPNEKVRQSPGSGVTKLVD